MKNLLIFIFLFLIGINTFSQNPNYQQKLFYTCKVWGFVKYYHSDVSVCQVNWDSVLLSKLPVIKNAVSGNDFNNVLSQMLQAAGPMAIATTPPPTALPLELRRNINFGWINDSIIRNDVKVILDTIKNNFRPHSNCWVGNNSGSGYGWLAFPYDNPILNSNLSTNYPDEFTRLMGIFRYWNIMNYFNPYNYILDTPWDSTLYNNVLSVANASTFTDFFMTFRKMTSNLNDAHVEGMTSNSLLTYVPKFLLRHSQGNYIVVKSGYTQINIGDIILSIDGKTTSQWEDSLRTFISAGNPSVFRRFMCYYMLRGASSSPIQIEYKDSLGNTNTLTLYRYSMYNNTWFNGYYPNDTLSAVTWKKWDCNVGYVHMGNLTTSDVNFMYSQLISTTAIIFDIRNYPKGTAWQLADLMYPNRICNGKFTEPNVAYPGTHFWYSSYLGINGNLSAYTGKVIILCNQQTQSHAEYTCMILRAMPNAVVVGSQTAGADGNITGFKFSQNISTGFTSLGCFYADGTETQKIGIVPDSFVYISPAGIRQSRDEVLEKALEIAGCIVSVNDNVDVKCELTIYPNPTSDNINISLSNAELSKMSISIFNSLGIEIKRFDEKELFGKNSISFSTESFPSGVYYCTMNNGTYKISKSFVVMR